MRKKIFLTLIITFFAVAPLFADGLPSGPGDTPCDPDDCPTPLDTWVTALAVTATIFTCVHLVRKQKAAINAA